MKKIAWNTVDLNILINSIGSDPYPPGIAPSFLVEHDERYFITRDDEGFDVLCRNISETEDPNTLDVNYIDSSQVSRVATAQEFIGSHPTHRPS